MRCDVIDSNYVYEVYKKRSFSAAAKSLFVSQPALSSAVKKVEKELGITIFDRSTSPISLTEEGKLYIAAVEKIRMIENDLFVQLSDVGQLKTGHICVGGANFVSSFVMPEIMLEFSKKYPGLSVDVIESNSPDLKQMVLDETLDLLIAHDFDGDQYTSEPIFDETLLLAVPVNFGINDKLKDFAFTKADIEQGKHLTTDKTVDLKLFENEPFILLKKGNDLSSRAATLFADAGFTPKVRMELDQLLTSYNVACSGLACAFAPDCFASFVKEDGCLFYKIAGEHTRRRMQIGYKKNRYCSRAIRAFIETTKEVYHNKDFYGNVK